MQYKLIQGLLAFSMLFTVWCAKAQNQVRVSGPVCVLNGAQYQYDIFGTDSTNINVCITGGKLVGTDSLCYNGSPLSSIKVIWTDTATGVITVTANSGTASINVGITKGLFAGLVDSASQAQNIQQGATPSPINCSAASGGSCTGGYVYQWQQSVDGNMWQDIDSADALNLTFTIPPAQNMYYRRRVQVSGTEGFSNTAIVFVTPVTASTPQ